ncbi:protein NUCLEAR FUSION DEFECTIVE 4-like [Carya illinoinensis]|uniref:protein NUCLEAR FUSION DEFECTIVE 4-like n=1 Tax=Carya illinoinensis TaxID=32201 RepID=UPI001C71FD51|nr:protein NUCLEAR FUSION DEFECTIVE 4-like [Carya illinoinensis]
MSSRSVLQWLSLVALWLQVVNGTNFNFPAYSIQLKKQLSISQMQLILLAFAFDAGKIFGFLPGLLADRLPLWLMLLIGSILGFVGYGFSFLLLKLHIYMYWVFFLFILFASLGISWINTVCNVVITRNFPPHHQLQVVAGIAISYQGLSAKIYTDFVHALFSPAPDKIAEAFLLLNSISAIIFLVTAAPILIPKIEFGRPRSIMRVGFAVLFFIALGTGIYSLISSLVPISPRGKIVGMGVLMDDHDHHSHLISILHRSRSKSAYHPYLATCNPVYTAV